MTNENRYQYKEWIFGLVVPIVTICIVICVFKKTRKRKGKCSICLLLSPLRLQVFRVWLPRVRGGWTQPLAILVYSDSPWGVARHLLLFQGRCTTEKSRTQPRDPLARPPFFWVLLPASSGKTPVGEGGRKPSFTEVLHFSFLLSFFRFSFSG